MRYIGESHLCFDHNMVTFVKENRARLVVNERGITFSSPSLEIAVQTYCNF